MIKSKYRLSTQPEGGANLYWSNHNLAIFLRTNLLVTDTNFISRNQKHITSCT